MPSRETGEPASTRDAPVPEERPSQGGMLLPVTIIAVGAVLTLAWFWLAVLLIRAVL